MKDKDLDKMLDYLYEEQERRSHEDRYKSLSNTLISFAHTIRKNEDVGDVMHLRMLLDDFLEQEYGNDED